MSPGESKTSPCTSHLLMDEVTNVKEWILNLKRFKGLFLLLSSQQFGRIR